MKGVKIIVKDEKNKIFDANKRVLMKTILFFEIIKYENKKSEKNKSLKLKK